MRKLLSMVLAVVLSVGVCGALSGCSKEDPEKTLYVEIENAGFGISWIDPLIDIFEAEHSGITVKKTFLTKKGNEMIDKVVSGSTHLDLLFVETDYALRNADKQIVSGGVTYDSPFAELTDIYEKNIPGENVKLKEKMLPAYYDYKKTVVNGQAKYYVMPWMQAPVGIVINNDVYRDSFGKLPNTTDELFSFCDNLPEEVTPFIHSLEESYWDDIYDVWMAQYNGSENMKKFYEGYALYVEGNPRYVPEILLDEGLLAAMKVWEKLLLPANNYNHPLSQTLDFTQVQNKFLEGDDNILFMPNGSWLEREMEANYDADELDIQFIKMPIVSALGTKLGITDAQLSAIIDYIDGTVTEEPTFTSSNSYTKAEVLSAVADARLMLASNYGFSSVIPSYSTKIDLAKEFLQLIASDRGIEAMLKECGSMGPFRYDIKNSPVKDDISKFMYSTNEMIQSGQYFFSHQDNLFVKGDLKLINNVSGRISIKFGAVDQGDRVSADSLYASNYNYARTMWDTIKRNAGIMA